MKRSHINGICYDILDVLSYINPLWRVNIKGTYKIDLLTGENNRETPKEDSVTEMLERKREWFLKRVGSLKWNPEDFQKAEITISDNTERVDIIYKNEEFSNMKDYRSIAFADKTKAMVMKEIIEEKPVDVRERLIKIKKENKKIRKKQKRE